MPPLMPAAKLTPVLPRITTRPPVMYSQPWSPTPSTTALAPLLRIANRSPTAPPMYASPRRRAVEQHVARDHVFRRVEPDARIGLHNDLAAGNPLAQIVVRFALQNQRQAPRAPRAETLARPSP